MNIIVIGAGWMNSSWTPHNNSLHHDGSGGRIEVIQVDRRGEMAGLIDTLLRRAYRTFLFQRMIRKYRLKNPEDLLGARNRLGFQVDIDDFATTVDSSNDIQLLERIRHSYMLSKREQPKDGTYSIRGIWAHMLQDYYKDLIDALASDDVNKLSGILSSIFVKGSTGLSMSGDIPDLNDKRSCQAYVNNFINFLLRLSTFVGLENPSKDQDNEGYLFEEQLRPQDLWKQVCEKIGIETSYPNVGSPFGLKTDTTNHVVPKVALRHLYVALRVRALLGDTSADILELGGGFGGVQYYLAKILRKPFTIQSVDIPEVNAISAYFLAKSLPEANVVLYGEEVNVKGHENTILILPNFKLRDIHDSVRIVINVDSLPEVPKETMCEYLRRISEISKYFYSSNQDSGRNGQNRLSQINPEEFGLRCISHNVDWLRSGYFERIYVKS